MRTVTPSWFTNVPRHVTTSVFPSERGRTVMVSDSAYTLSPKGTVTLLNADNWENEA